MVGVPSQRGRPRRGFVERKLTAFARSAYSALSVPLVVLFLFHNRRVHAAYRMTWWKKFALGYRMYRNTRRVFTATSYRAHLAMAVKLLEIPPEVKGVVVECGAFIGGSTANLSLVCDIVGRQLIVYDSFEGLPAADPNDKYADPKDEGQLRGDLETVKGNVRHLGAIERCTFRKGWFSDTLPRHQEPIVLCFLDVDFQASLHDCVRHLWPHLTPRGYMFIDEYVYVDYCALFFSERWWRTYFDTAPPGLVGAGSGVGLGQYYVGPYAERLPIQTPSSVAYTRKDFLGLWAYYPENESSRPDEPVPPKAKVRSHE
jgi:O-methyltransferase